MHVGGVATFAVRPAGRVAAITTRGCCRIGERIGAAPRYRQKLCWIPGGSAKPVWVDDPDFDVGHHSAATPCRAPAATPSSRAGRPDPVPPTGPQPAVWELHLVEGLSDNRFALIIKIHHAMVDGIGGLDDLGRLFFDRCRP